MLSREKDNALYESYSDDIPTLLKKIYASRCVTESQLDMSLPGLLKPNFDQLNIALELLERAIYEDKKILIIGDFDADGATASAVAIKALRLMGAKYVDFLVPNRFKHGYGLSPEIVNEAKIEKEPDLIITVDNGISSNDGTALARSFGIDVIITDHHLPPKDLPEANSIINPNLRGCDFPSKSLAGVGVSFYLFSSLKTHLVAKGYFEKQNIELPDLRELLDLVALGTVADVVKLDQNNRILINEGIKRIRQKRCSKGILAILELTKRPVESLQASDLGFTVAPRINAAGRLSDISQGIRCLLSEDINDARRYALNLEEFNIKRRKEQTRMQDEALAIVEEQLIDESQFAIVLYDETWHEGVVGIVAGKLKETYQCPCAVFAKADKVLKGSIRSIPDVHIKDLLETVAINNPGLIEKYGGHAMAAGLSIIPENFKIFKEAFSEAITKHLEGKKPIIELLTDGKLEASEITLKNAELLRQASPWGQGFEEPIFYGDFELIEQKIVGEKHLKCTLKLIDNSSIFEGIAFFQEKLKSKKVRVAYKLNVNSFRGNESLQLMIELMEII
ncbi:single-stranded-DNA-specific exonuclease RecJ [Candidatus Thioglobus sp. NP1]|uniref:single-stranded-DNA-specific exonuclease RecJ n=1 Tax=Candidatus Thioglobus sp. NP1 TaxID=2508687 RepID=UPI000DEDA18E|nr:single-stranded-DNA-specific exonuclease RecJ [Candidatus Thioglobus sp. NP1]AXE61934.1 single-stranded-DNA-specific exonuclease RecJ [Candidatus Thioglobus sp. NP1]